ncbi:MAG TPA: hypothetical protein VM261_01705 [Kofleriaceae bacterium]|nr:hypothetical protein [Kofleriaceae bacterium]
MQRSARRLGSVLALALGSASASGCFYGDVINERPSAAIERLGAGIPFRGGTLQFRAVVDDPDRDPTQPTWRFEACNAGNICAADETGSDPLFTVTVPPMVEGRPTTRVVVTLDVEDIYGATARPAQRLELDVDNNAPTAAVQKRGREIAGKFPPDVPIVISARGMDVDGDSTTLVWELLPARNSVEADRVWQTLPDPISGGEERRLVPDVDGDWKVKITVADDIDTTIYEETIIVVPDQPPCLGALDPAPPPAGSSIVLDAPRRIGVLVVEDDLDIYPAPPPDDPYLGPAGLRWYVRAPGTTSYALVDTDVGGLELDPAHYDPGDRLDVRVEIDDRLGRAVQCAEGVATCSLGQNTCLQRQTWSVEVR